MSGRTENNRVVNFDGDTGLIGSFVDLIVTAAYTNSLQAEIVACPENESLRKLA